MKNLISFPLEMQWCRSSGFLPWGQKSKEGCMDQLMPVLARLSPSGRSDSSVAWPSHSVRLVELRGSLASDPLLPWRFAFSPCLTPALICLCCPTWAEVGYPRCLPGTGGSLVLGCGELPLQSWSCSLHLGLITCRFLSSCQGPGQRAGKSHARRL